MIWGFNTKNADCPEKRCWDCIFLVQCRLLSDLIPKQMHSLVYLKSSLPWRVQHFVGTPVSCMLEMSALKWQAWCCTPAGWHFFYKEVMQHMCNPLWLISHQCWLNHTSTYKSSDWLQKQESIKHCLSQTRSSWYISYSSICGESWSYTAHFLSKYITQLHVNKDTGQYLRESASHQQVALLCQITPHTHNRGWALESRSVLKRSYFIFHGWRLHGALKHCEWRLEVCDRQWKLWGRWRVQVH